MSYSFLEFFQCLSTIFNTHIPNSHFSFHKDVKKIFIYSTYIHVHGHTDTHTHIHGGVDYVIRKQYMNA